MSKQTAQDEDLIILSDDTEAENALEDLTLDFDEESTDNEVITFWEEEVSIETELVDETAEEEIILTLDDEEVSEEIIEEVNDEVETEVEALAEEETEETVEEAGTEEAEEGFSLDLSEAEETEVEVEEETAESTESLDLWGFDLTPDTDSAASEVATAAVAGWSMNSILEATIAQLEARRDAIWDERSGKTSKVVDLKDEIKKLEDEVFTLQWEIEGLDQESGKIALNISSLDDMKLEDADNAREHNYESVKG